MAEKYDITGMTPETIHKEAYMFKEYTQTIVDSKPEIADKARLVYYDGNGALCPFRLTSLLLNLS